MSADGCGRAMAAGQLLRWARGLPLPLLLLLLLPLLLLLLLLLLPLLQLLLPGGPGRWRQKEQRARPLPPSAPLLPPPRCAAASPCAADGRATEWLARQSQGPEWL
jgi:hypothetical protein